jgi:hypothetical protein
VLTSPPATSPAVRFSRSALARRGVTDRWGRVDPRACSAVSLGALHRVHLALELGFVVKNDFLEIALMLVKFIT